MSYVVSFYEVSGGGGRDYMNGILLKELSHFSLHLSFPTVKEMWHWLGFLSF